MRYWHNPGVIIVGINPLPHNAAFCHTKDNYCITVKNIASKGEIACNNPDVISVGINSLTHNAAF